MTWMAAAAASAAATTAVIKYIDAEKQSGKEDTKKQHLEDNMKRIEAARQKIPYIGRHYKDLSNTMSNKFANLGVATGAAEFQAEQGAQQRANIMSQLRGAALV